MIKMASAARSLMQKAACLSTGFFAGLVLLTSCSSPANLLSSYALDSGFIQRATHYQPVVQSQDPQVAFGPYSLQSLSKEKVPLGETVGRFVGLALFPPDVKIKDREYHAIFTRSTDTLTASFTVRTKEQWERQRFKLLRKNEPDDVLLWEEKYASGVIKNREGEEWLFTAGPYAFKKNDPFTPMQAATTGHIAHKGDTLHLEPIPMTGKYAEESSKGFTVTHSGQVQAMALLGKKPQVWLSQESSAPPGIISCLLSLLLATQSL